MNIKIAHAWTTFFSLVIMKRFLLGDCEGSFLNMACVVIKLSRLASTREMKFTSRNANTHLHTYIHTHKHTQTHNVCTYKQMHNTPQRCRLRESWRRGHWDVNWAKSTCWLASVVGNFMLFKNRCLGCGLVDQHPDELAPKMLSNGGYITFTVFCSLLPEIGNNAAFRSISLKWRENNSRIPIFATRRPSLVTLSYI